MKTNETYYQVRLTERIGDNHELSRVMRLKFQTVKGAKMFASELLNLVAYGSEGCRKQTDSAFVVTYAEPKTKTLRFVCRAEVVDQDGNVHKI